MLLFIKVIGSYAAAGMLILLGGCIEIRLYNLFQQVMSEKCFSRRDFDESEALSLGNEWGEWTYPVGWFDMLNAYRVKKLLKTILKIFTTE